MRRSIKLLFLFLLICIYLARTYLYLDFANGCVLKIIPTIMPANAEVKKGVLLIKNVSPSDYSELCSLVDNINLNPGCGGLDGGCFYEDQHDTIYVGNDQGNIALSASIIIHEVCHLKQYISGRGLSEPECYQKGNDFLNSVTFFEIPNIDEKYQNTK